MTTLASIAVLLGVVSGLVPVWLWLVVCAVTALRSPRLPWWQIGIASIIVELILPIRIGELSLPLLASVGVVAVAYRFMADVGAFERRGLIASSLVTGFCVIVSSLASRGVGSTVYGVPFWYGMLSVELVYAWLLALVWLVGSSVVHRYTHV